MVEPVGWTWTTGLLHPFLPSGLQVTDDVTVVMVIWSTTPCQDQRWSCDLSGPDGGQVLVVDASTEPDGPGPFSPEPSLAVR